MHITVIDPSLARQLRENKSAISSIIFKTIGKWVLRAVSVPPMGQHEVHILLLYFLINIFFHVINYLIRSPLPLSQAMPRPCSLPYRGYV